MKKLVVHFDDDPFVTGLSAGLLRPHDITVVQRIRGDHIFEVLQRVKPGVLIMELDMKGLDGLDMISAIKEYNPAVQIIVLTRIISTQMMLSCLDRGATEYLNKPLQDNEQLLEVVQSCFGRLRRWQEHFDWLDLNEVKTGPPANRQQELCRSLLLQAAEYDIESSGIESEV